MGFQPFPILFPTGEEYLRDCSVYPSPASFYGVYRLDTMTDSTFGPNGDHYMVSPLPSKPNMSALPTENLVLRHNNPHYRILAVVTENMSGIGTRLQGL